MSGVRILGGYWGSIVTGPISIKLAPRSKSPSALNPPYRSTPLPIPIGDEKNLLP
jgi:hypothetical protein